MSSNFRTEQPCRNMFYLETEVPNMPGSEWNRHILYMQDKATIVIDQVIADNPGEFDITCSWSLFAGNLDTSSLPDITITTVVDNDRAILLSHADALEVEMGRPVKQKAFEYLEKDETTTIGNAFSLAANAYVIRRVEGQANVYRVSNGGNHSIIVLGHFEKDGFSVNADFAYCTMDIILTVNDGVVQTEAQSDSAGFAEMLANLELRQPQTNQEDDI